jgi:hypothetical protein
MAKKRCIGAGCNGLAFQPDRPFQPYAFGPYNPSPYGYASACIPYYGGYIPLLWR